LHQTEIAARFRQLAIFIELGEMLILLTLILVDVLLERGILLPAFSSLK
jgi:hypothetical protein